MEQSAHALAWQRRRPERTDLYRVLQPHLATFLARRDADPDRGTLPAFVRRELERYLDCGILARGFCRVHWESCGQDSLVAWSCRGRGFCPSCAGRRMAAQAAHLAERVLPDAPIRQWVLSLPHKLRFLLAGQPELCTRVRGIFARAALSFVERRARDELSIPQSRCGAVIATQRSDSALRCDIHFHAILLDEVYTGLGPGETPVFHRLPKPSQAQIEGLVRHIAALILGDLRRHGHLDADGGLDPSLGEDPDPLAHCQIAAVQGLKSEGPAAGQRQDLFGSPMDPGLRPPKLLCADFASFSLHAAVTVPGGSKHQHRRERLCRYLCRGPIAQDRVQLTRQGRVMYRFKRPWRNGAEAVVLDPLDFIARLAALVPYPPQHLLTYHGLFAPAARGRERVVKGWGDEEGIAPRCRRGPDTRSRDRAALSRPRYIVWAELLRRVFRREVLVCPSCGGRRRVLRIVESPAAVERVLTHMGLDARPPPRAGPLGVPGLLSWE